jgi:sec-independent protein translocase protein TatB
MFGMGGSEIIVILIVALLFLGPDKLPQAAKSISKGIRDIKKQSRMLQQQIESDEQIGGAIRDLKSALRGEDAPIRPKPFTPRPQGQLTEGVAAAGVTASIGGGDAAASSEAAAAEPTAAEPAAAANGAAPAITLPPTAGEPDPVAGPASAGDDDLASMIKPASGTVAKGS